MFWGMIVASFGVKVDTASKVHMTKTCSFQETLVALQQLGSVAWGGEIWSHSEAGEHDDAPHRPRDVEGPRIARATRAPS